MSNKFLFVIGILGVTLFIIAAFLGGFLFDDYNPLSQYISESYAIDTPYGKSLRYFGYIPSGILLTLFSFMAFKKFPTSRLIKLGFMGLGIFYGMATIMVGIFPCDSGCNRELIDPSTSQLIHNLMGLLTYVFVPISILLISIGLKQMDDFQGLSKIGFTCGFVSFVCIGYLVSDPFMNYAGLLQRIIEGLFIIWIIACSVVIKNASSNSH